LVGKLRAVIFDWDGTLVDTAEASYRCYVRLFDELGVAFDREAYARTYSPNWYQTFRALGVPEERWDHADTRWLTHFAEERVELIDGVRDVLRELAGRGIDAAIVTSGSRDRVTREIQAHGLAETIRECVCGSDVAQKKPHPEALQLCIERLRIDPGEAAYVGDSPEDIEMARAAGVFAVAVPGGYPNREALMASRPDAMHASVREAVRALTRGLASPSW
jgi:HAD superfamily hydrolase (TIGR01509 family)